MKTTKWLKRFLSFFTWKTVIKKEPLCTLSIINSKKNFVIVHCRGFNSSIKLSFDEVIKDNVILSNLAPFQASWIGYYFGRYYISFNPQKHNPTKAFDHGLSNEHSTHEYVFTMINRQGDIIYYDNFKDETKIISPINAMMNKKIIFKFSPMHACYIGILAGISEYKKTNARKSFISPTHLRLVK